MTWTVDASGTLTAGIGIEYALDVATINATYVLAVDTNALALGDLLELRIYDKTDGTNLRQVWKGTYQHGQINNAKQSPSIDITGGGLFTLKLVAGTAPKSFPYAVRSVGGTGTSPSWYTGPGDIVSGVTAWYGLRGLNAAYASGKNPAVDLVDQAGANPITINILADGTLDVASISAWVTAKSVTTIKAKKLYDQTGTGNHAVQATLATMPTLVLGPITGLASTRPALVFGGSQYLQATDSNNFSPAQPESMSIVAIRTSGTSTQGVFAGGGGNDMEFGFDTTNNAYIFAGSTLLDASATDNAWHALSAIANGASSTVNVDGASTTGATGTGNAGLFNKSYFIGRDAFSNFFNGKANEFGLWFNQIFNSTAMANLSANQHTYWGF